MFHFNSHAHVERDCFATLFVKQNIFQLTRSRGAWLTPWLLPCSLLEFQLTRSRGAWLDLFIIVSRWLNFNSHAHVERDKRSRSGRRTDIHFNSHAHVERDDWHCRPYKRLCQFQLTRSRGAWHRATWNYLHMVNFNSHAHVERDTKW